MLRTIYFTLNGLITLKFCFYLYSEVVAVDDVWSRLLKLFSVLFCLMELGREQPCTIGEKSSLQVRITIILYLLGSQEERCSKVFTLLWTLGISNKGFYLAVEKLLFFYIKEKIKQKTHEKQQNSMRFQEKKVLICMLALNIIFRRTFRMYSIEIVFFLIFRINTD